MNTGKVLNLYMTLPDMMRSGNRTECDSFDCDENGITGDVNYENEPNNMILLVSQVSYEIIESAELEVSNGFLLENIYVDMDLNHLKEGTVIEVGDVLFEVLGPCKAYNYLYGIDPDLPEKIDGKRGIFLRACEFGTINIGDEVKVVQES